MFKKLSDLEKSMCSVMKALNTSEDIGNSIRSFTTDELNALHQCYINKYIENIDEWTDANGTFHYNLLGKNTHINKEGLKFIQNLSLAYRIRNFLFDTLKGTQGFILGVLASLIVKYFDDIVAFLQSLLGK